MIKTIAQEKDSNKQVSISFCNNWKINITQITNKPQRRRFDVCIINTAMTIIREAIIS